MQSLWKFSKNVPHSQYSLTHTLCGMDLRYKKVDCVAELVSEFWYSLLRGSCGSRCGSESAILFKNKKMAVDFKSMWLLKKRFIIEWNGPPERGWALMQWWCSCWCCDRALQERRSKSRSGTKTWDLTTTTSSITCRRIFSPDQQRVKWQAAGQNSALMLEPGGKFVQGYKIFVGVLS